MNEARHAGPRTSGPTDSHDSATPDPAPVVIAMLTYLRPEGLDSALPRLLEQISTVDHDVSILVIDNDPKGGAMTRSSEFPAGLVRFVHEPTPGIAAARNRAFSESADKRLLIFIDDDERPEPDWLKLLIQTWQTATPTAVVGPVISVFPTEPDPWIVAGEFFNRRRMPTGTVVQEAATNNLLLDMDQIRSFNLRFDAEFGVSGGSDSVFTQQICAKGGDIVWCDEAIVVDVVPPERMTRDWVLRRRLRTGNGSSRVAVALAGTPARRLIARLRLTALGLARIVGGAARLAGGTAARSVPQQAKGAKTLARGLGMMGGAWGFTYFEYSRKGKRQTKS